MLALTRPGALNPTPQVAFSGEKGAKCTGEACQRTATPRDATRNRSQPVSYLHERRGCNTRAMGRSLESSLSRPHPFQKFAHVLPLISLSRLWRKLALKLRCPGRGVLTDTLSLSLSLSVGGG